MRTNSYRPDVVSRLTAQKYLHNNYEFNEKHAHAKYDNFNNWKFRAAELLSNNQAFRSCAEKN